MNYEEEVIREAETYGQVLGVADLAIALGLERPVIDVALATEGDALGEAIKRGRIRAKAELRLGLLKLAGQGSSPAQLQAKEFIQQLES